ncbi:MAG TPA: hypothetical protein VJH68_02535 [Candidatus Nanoarchaeia archaeon]|nr:hypothetical protein [Candidatus Nanoarchaeia archaeon]
MNQLFFDSGPIISLVMSRLGWLLPLLKQQFNGNFYITPAVKHELVDRPITIHRFEFEALEVLKLISEGALTVYENVPWPLVKKLSALADNSFSINGKALDVVQEGELESVACALQENAPLAIDERTLRMFIEDCLRMKDLLERRFQKKVLANKTNMLDFNKLVKGVKIIRSAELVAVAYQLGLLQSYVPKLSRGNDILVEAVLWSTKYNGCAITEHEIDEIKSSLLKS